MSKRLNKLVTFFLNFFWRRGRQGKIEESEMVVGVPKKLQFKTIDSYDLNIYCQKKQYRREYDRWFLPVTKQYSYLVYGVPVGLAPPEIVEACKETLEVIALSPDFLWDEYQMQLAVNNYLELLTERLIDIRTGF